MGWLGFPLLLDPIARRTNLLYAITADTRVGLYCRHLQSMLEHPVQAGEIHFVAWVPEEDNGMEVIDIALLLVETVDADNVTGFWLAQSGKRCATCIPF